MGFKRVENSFPICIMHQTRHVSAVNIQMLGNGCIASVEGPAQAIKRHPLAATHQPTVTNAGAKRQVPTPRGKKSIKNGQYCRSCEETPPSRGGTRRAIASCMPSPRVNWTQGQGGIPPKVNQKSYRLDIADLAAWHDIQLAPWQTSGRR